MTRLILKSARFSAGIAIWARPSRVKKDQRVPRISTVSPRPVEGSQPSWTAKTMMSISPTQKVGSEKPRIDPAMMALEPTLFGRSPA